MRKLGFITLPLLLGLLCSCANGGGELTCSSDLDCDGRSCLDSRCVGSLDAGRGRADASPSDAGSSSFDATPRDADTSGSDAGTTDSGAADTGPAPACSVPTDCSDSSMCTTDDCVTGACVFAPVSCDDSDACTTDSCDPATGCASTPSSCDDADVCTVDSCDSTSGCANVPVVVPGGTCATPIDISRGGTFSGDSGCAASDFAGVCVGGTGPDTAFVFDLSAESTVRLDASAASFTPILFLGSSCGDSSRACESSGSGVVSATLPAGRYYAGLDGRLSTDAGSWSLSVTITPAASEEVLTFPNTGDTRIHAIGDRFWNLGDSVEGSRATSLSSIRFAALTLSVTPNDLTCDNQDMRLRINGTVVGSVIIPPGVTTVTPSFTFPGISGPSYRLRLETTRTVDGGCGSAGLPNGVSTIRVGN